VVRGSNFRQFVLGRMKLQMLVCAFLVPCAVSAIWPVPQKMSQSGAALPVSSNFEFDVEVNSSLLSRAAARYQGFMVLNASTMSGDTFNVCKVHSDSCSEDLRYNTSYAYTLTIQNGDCTITSPTVFGAIYGMESLYQLAPNGTLLNSTVSIQDFPDYKHRGIMIDTGRRFWPVELVQNVINVMSFDKMNVLHLHASDMCRFGVESKLFPELTESLGGIKEGHYTQEDIRSLVKYARDRGVLVLPEFDMPGHAACFLPMKNRGLEFCNEPILSPIPNWCTLQAGNGTAAWDLMPQLAMEMASLFGSEVYHIGGDETRCGGSSSFEKHLLNVLNNEGYMTMAWSEVLGARTNNTIIHAWRGNASTLATQGVLAVDSEPNKFYIAGNKESQKVTNSWSDLGKDSVPIENRHLLLGGEVAFWTDEYCYINECVRPGSTKGGGHEFFGRDYDSEFARSAGGVLWPRTHQAAGSFWNFRADLSLEEVDVRANYEQNTLAARRGGLVCPSGCKCTVGTICGEPLLPPTPTPPPPAAPSKKCKWMTDHGLVANDFKSGLVSSQEDCCGWCIATAGCAAADWNPVLKECHLKKSTETIFRNDGSLACVPMNETSIV